MECGVGVEEGGEECGEGEEGGEEGDGAEESAARSEASVSMATLSVSLVVVLGGIPSCARSSANRSRTCDRSRFTRTLLDSSRFPSSPVCFSVFGILDTRPTRNKNAVESMLEFRLEYNHPPILPSSTLPSSIMILHGMMINVYWYWYWGESWTPGSAQ